MKRTTWARSPAPSGVEFDKRSVQAPRERDVISEIGVIIAIHLAVALAVVWTLAGLGIG